MAAVDMVVRICNRCPDGKLAKHFGVRFGLNGRLWTGDLCDSHMDLLRRDLMTWATCFDELTMTPADSDEIVTPKESQIKAPHLFNAARVPDQLPPRVKVRPITSRRTVVLDDDTVTPVREEVPDVSDISPEVMESWTFLMSAQKAMDRSSVGIVDVWRVLDAIHKDVRPGRTPDTQVWERDGVGVIVNPAERKVITVMRFGHASRPLLATGAGY
jgi:hypothetical protein